MKKLSSLLPIALLATMATAGVAQAATPAPDVVGQGTQHWVYAPGGPTDQGDAPFDIEVDTRGTSPGTAIVTYSFSSTNAEGGQITLFLWNSGSQLVTGNWATGWSGATSDNGGQSVEIGPYGDGTNIYWEMDGFAQGAGLPAQGPWTSEGTWNVTAQQ